MRKLINPNIKKHVDDAGYLLELSRKLRQVISQCHLSQDQIEAATGVDQTTISRAKNGKLKRVTDGIRRLERYADMQQEKPVKLSMEVQRTAQTFLAVGGTERELLGSIRHATRIVLRHVKN